MGILNNINRVKSDRLIKKGVLTTFIILIPALLIAGIYLIINNIERPRDNDTVFTINDEPVSKAEYLFIMSGLKANVFSYFVQKHDAKESKKFWTSEFRGEIPAELLAKKTVELLKRLKTEQILIKENGITNNISFGGFLADLETENERRRLAFAKNLPIYGPVQYEERVFYDYLHTERVEKLKRILSSGELSVKEEEIIISYEKLKITEKESVVNMNSGELRNQIERELFDRKYEDMIRRMMDESLIDFRMKSLALNRLQRTLF